MNTHQSLGEIRLNFNHRIVELHDNSLDISDTINAMANRALGVLHLIALQFDDGSPKMSDDLIANALDSVICEINDIQAYSLAMTTRG